MIPKIRRILGAIKIAQNKEDIAITELPNVVDVD